MIVIDGQSFKRGVSKFPKSYALQSRLLTGLNWFGYEGVKSIGTSTVSRIHKSSKTEGNPAVIGTLSICDSRTLSANNSTELVYFQDQDGSYFFPNY